MVKVLGLFCIVSVENNEKQIKCKRYGVALLLHVYLYFDPHFTIGQVGVLTP